MPRHQLIGLEHAGAFGDRHLAGVKGKLQRPFRGFAALPEMLLFGQNVVLDVADGQRTIAPQQPHHLAGVLRLHGSKPSVALAPVLPHRRDEEAKILRRHIGQRVRPVLEHAFVDALRPAQVRAGITRDAAIENVMMAALDDVNGVDLHIAEMVHRRRHRLRSGPERLVRIEPLGVQPDSPGLGLGQGAGFSRAGHRAAM